MITVKRVSNGYIVKDDFDEPSDPAEELVYVTDGEDEHSNNENILNMIWGLLNKIQEDGKFKEETVTAMIEHGRKYECNDKKCKVCGGEF